MRDPNWIIKLVLAAGEAVAQKKNYGPISNEHEIFIQTIVSHSFGFTSFMFRRFASHAAGQQPEAPAFVYRSASSKITGCVSSPFDWTMRDPNWIIKLALPPLPTRAGGRARSPAATEQCHQNSCTVQKGNKEGV